MTELELIGVPLYYGCDNPGTEGAFDAFLHHGVVEQAQAQGLGVARAFSVPVPSASGRGPRPDLEYLPQVMDTCRSLEQAVSDCLGRGRFPLVIGGDHSLGIGSLAGVSRHCQPQELTVIWVDAHTDINTHLTSGSHHIHGMPLAACLGLGAPELYQGMGGHTPMLLPQNLIYLGIRSVDPGEWEILRRYGIRHYGMEQLRQRGMGEVLGELLDTLPTNRIHLSFDVDFIDAGAFTATGLPIPDGPSVEDARLCLQALLESGRVGSMDFVEYSPRHDRDGQGLAVCSGLLDSCFASLARAGQGVR